MRIEKSKENTITYIHIYTDAPMDTQTYIHVDHIFT